MKNKKIVIIFLVALIGYVYAEKLNVSPVEELNIASGYGV